MVNFKSIPFLKIVLPYIIGIICSLNFFINSSIHVIFVITVILWVISFIFQKTDTTSFVKKTIFILLSNILLFVLAYESSYIYNARNNKLHYSHFVNSKKQKIIATVNDIIVTKEKYIKIPVDINYIEHNQKWNYVQGKSIIYLKTSQIEKLEIGEKLYAQAKFNVISNPKNPYEFNYKKYLEQQNIFSIVFTNKENAFSISEKNVTTFANFGTKIKAKVVAILKNNSLSKQTAAICSALLVGYDDEIDNYIIQSFSHTGTLHILSVSGMHTGVLYAVIIWFFSLIDKNEKYKKTRFITITLFLILFVFITGLSPSVLRASLMLIIMLCGKTFFKQSNTYNTLLFSAFIILLYNPYLLIDVGFLLSYFAVFGILYLYPIINNLYFFKNKIIQFAWSSTIISFSATLFTLPISLFYFNQFPIWFILSNLLIIPISTVLLICAALFLIIYKITSITAIIAYLMNSCSTIMIWISSLTDNPKYGYIDSISFNNYDLVFTILFIITLLWIFNSKKYYVVLISGIVCLLWIISSINLYIAQSKQNEFIVFHTKGKTTYLVRSGKNIYLYKDTEYSNIERHIKPYLLSIPNYKIYMLNVKQTIKIKRAIISNGNNNNEIKNFKQHYVIVSNNNLPNITTRKNISIITDCTNSYKFVNKLKKQCDILNVPIYSVQENGFFKISL